MLSVSAIFVLPEERCAMPRGHRKNLLKINMFSFIFKFGYVLSAHSTAGERF